MPSVPADYRPDFDLFVRAPTMLGEAVRGLELSRFNKRPLGDDWAIRDHVMHLLDAETVLATRLRWTLAEDNPVLPSWDQDLWKRRLHYLWRDPDAALSLFGQLRWTNAELLNQCDAASWERTAIRAGEPITLAGLMQRAVAHAAEHLVRINEIREL